MLFYGTKSFFFTNSNTHYYTNIKSSESHIYIQTPSDYLYLNTCFKTIDLIGIDTQNNNLIYIIYKLNNFTYIYIYSKKNFYKLKKNNKPVE